MMDAFYTESISFEHELDNIKIRAQIFEQPVIEFLHLDQTERELKLLKSLWDYVNVIRTSLNEWKTTLWETIDVEGMDQNCKNFIKELRGIKTIQNNFNKCFKISCFLY